MDQIRIELTFLDPVLDLCSIGNADPDSGAWKLNKINTKITLFPAWEAFLPL
jgi:hypothetical protein